MSTLTKPDLASRGENLAAQFLKLKGYEVLRQNYHTPYGEIDIIAREQNDIAFIEVKTRSRASRYFAENSISHIKKKRITLSAQHYLNKECPDETLNFRFDVIVILYHQTDDTYKIIHLPDAYHPVYS